ncbi:uncharacterized protein LOC133180906 [Saccostrea echinata]|uniref:uncharacterized protein LOC133180906 n=1 Tax=Saccostrea echinata TaxID=191078 RepID=UPI002A81B8B0|nr:uncharacterized protein LOC133180906 [Saccostrea echinata]
MWRIRRDRGPQCEHVNSQINHDQSQTSDISSLHNEDSPATMMGRQPLREKLLRVWFGVESSRGRRRPLPAPVMVCVGVILMAAAVCAISSLSYNYYLRIRVPPDSHIRRIRSYSENPSISAISISSNSMALVTRVHIMDVKAMCRTDPTRCETYAICDTLQGALNCRCKRGYFVKNRECSACSTSCPDGYYMTHQCSAHQDLVCRECTKCKGSTYEAAKCSSTQDTICMNVNFPVTNVRWEATIREPNNSTSVSISSSNNVFMECLENVRDKEIPLPLNSNQIQMEFPIIRKSGLEVNVKVSQTYLIPEYVDLDHEDDAPFFFQNKFSTYNMKKRMRFIQDNYCRDVVPDYYKVILNILPDHYTVARMDTCQPTKSDPCPEGVKEGDPYLNRKLYIKCPYSDGKESNFSQLFQSTNMMYCSLPNSLLTNTFGLEGTKVTTLNFPTQECKQSMELCQECQQQCEQKSSSADDITCCRVTCFSKRTCQKAFSEDCPQRPIECARGDVYRYSIEPVFKSLEKKFTCHMKYRKPPKLYKVSYTVKLPSIQHTFKTRYFSPKVTDRGFHQTGEASQDFIHTKHSTYSNIHDEVILTGTNFDDNTPTRFYMQPMKKPEEFNTRKNFGVRPYRSEWQSNVYSTTVQFERPFLYSAITWSRGGCDAKNFSQIYPQQPLHTAEKTIIDPTISKVDGKFEYQAISLKEQAEIRIGIKGDRSILASFEKDIGPTVINSSSFTGNLEWQHYTRSWNITVNGTLLKCPGYLTMDVYDQFMESYFGKYDIFVKCPSPQFSFSFLLPRSRSDTPNVFAVFVNDTKASHKILLTMLINPTNIPVTTELVVRKHATNQFPWMPIIVILIFSGILVTVFVIAAFCISRIRQVTTNDVFKYAGVTFLKDDERSKQDDGSRPLKTPISRSVTCCLVTLYVVYALMFTFSVLLGVFYIVQGPLIGNLTIVSNTSAKIHQAVELRFHNMQEFEISEISHMYNQTRDRLRACSYHNLQEIKKIVEQMQEQLDSFVKHFYIQNKTIENILTNTLEEKSKTLEEELSEFLKEYNKTLQSEFKTVLSKYHQFLKSLMKNDWLKFPEQLFIGQKELIDSKQDMAHLLGFMDWLEINQVEETLHVTDGIMKTLSSSLPALDSNLKLSLSDDDLLVNSIEELTNQLTSHNFHILENELNFMPSMVNQHNFSSSNQARRDSYSSTASLIEKMKSILFPVFICVFLFMDVLLLLYRFTWLRQMFRKAKMGIEEKVAMDSVAGKIYFILTGIDAEKRDKPRERHFSYSDSKDIYERKNDLLQYFQGGSPKGKEHMLQQIYSQKRSKQRTTMPAVQEKVDSYTMVKKVARFVYKHLISPLLWRIVLVGAFILIISLVTMTTNDLVTIDTATFLMDTKSILPQLHRQIEISNNLLSDFAVLSNEMLTDFQTKTFMEVNDINFLLGHTVQKHTSIVQNLVQELCSIENASPCQQVQPSLSLLESLQTCNFMPIYPQYLQEFQDATFMEYLHTELLPLVVTLRQILFNTCYILFGFACLMLISQIFIRVILFYLLKTNRLPKVTMYLVSNANECWKASPMSPHSSVYRSYSLIESCESGVVGDIDDHYRDPTTLHPTTHPH